jgi:hypothetical protein
MHVSRAFQILAISVMLAMAVGARVSKAAETAERWGIYEIRLQGPTAGNPFTDVDFSVHFTHGDTAVDVAGFYDGDGIYRVRFMPAEPGDWRYLTHGNRPELDGKGGTFVVTPAAAGNHGPVGVRDTYHFAYADGTPYFPLGTTCYSWTHRSEAQEEQTLRTLSTSPFNKIRMCVFPQNHAAKDQRFFPFEGEPPQHWDFTRFNPAFFRHLEERVGQLRDLGIEADLILFHPYGQQWGFSGMEPANDDRYLRYLVARLGAFRNVWWSLANEFDFISEKKESDWDRLFQVVQRSDPYAHLRSIHNGAKIYNNTLPWVTHASIQNGAAVEDSERAELYRDVYRKPVVYDEVKYEGNISARWGQLTAEELVRRFWSGYVAGTYVGHGEILRKPGETDSWLGGGGTLRGESPPRLAFLRKIMEAGPARGIEPIDKWQDEHTGGRGGEYYLVYFGAETPKSWPFELYKGGVRDGLTFQVDVIDTWNMTITPVPGAFVTKKRDAYVFEDADKKSVTLPGTPYLAVRIRRIDSLASHAN